MVVDDHLTENNQDKSPGFSGDLGRYLTSKKMSKLLDILCKRMGRALAAARRAASRGEVPVGAALYHDNKLLATAGNRMQARHDATAHAEMLLLRRLSRWQDLDAGDMTLYITLEPCPMCAGAIIMARIGTVVWGAADPRYGAGGSAFQVLSEELPQPQPTVISGIRQEECSQLLKQFFPRLRR
jgi:tRNA(adenine34) deaminase